MTVLPLAVFLLAASASHVCQGSNIFQILSSMQRESTMVQLMTKSGLGRTVSAGNFTVFAPTDEAFALLPQGILDELHNNQTALSQTLSYHVVQGKMPHAQLYNKEELTTLAGKRVNLYRQTDKLTVEGVPVTTFDTMADNGVIHTVDRIIMPPAGNVLDYISTNSNFSTFYSLVQKTGLIENLKDERLTLFVPTNDAFQALGNSLQQLENHVNRLRDVLAYHVVDQTLYSSGLYDYEFLSSNDTNHDQLFVQVSHPSGITINNSAKVISADIPATNGVIHVINKVLVPLGVQVWLSFGIVG